MRFARLCPAATAALLILPAAASAADPPTPLPTVERTVTVAEAAKRTSCLVPGPRRGVTRTTYTAPMGGYLTIRLAARRGDWDLAAFGAGQGLGGSQGFRAREVVQGWVSAGDRVTVQACRRSGRARRARLAVTLVDAARPAGAAAPKLVRVAVGDAGRLAQLERLGVDVTHNVRRGAADVLVADGEQLELLHRAGFRTRTLIEDLTAHYRASRAADVRAAAATEAGSALPSGRETYRDYEDYGRELKALADSHPGLVEPVTIGRSYQGRELSGVEIASAVGRDDGRPVYLVVALHHAREWPSAEAAMELAHLLVDQRANPRIARILATTRTVIVPLINPDGFITARRAAPVDPASNLSDDGVNPAIPLFGDLTTAEGVAPPGGILSYRRKNCAGDIPNPSIPCELQWGVDPNRNYGEGWGGAGSSAQPFSQSYRGPGPWSEPETQAVHRFSAGRQVTTIVTLHNVAALVLRPPARSDGGSAPDEPRMKEVGDAMAQAAGYTSQFGFQLYDTAGTTEDWNYAAQGAYGYTIEIGPKDGEFHMPYQTGVVDQWTGAYAGNGKGLREALLIGASVAGNPADHAIVSGSARPGVTLRLRKAFTTFTSPFCRRAIGAAPFNIEEECVDGPHERLEIEDELDTTLKVPANGRFAWHANPSTRPFVGAMAFIETAEAPSRTQAFAAQEDTTPNPGLPVGAGDSSEDQAFSVQAAEDIARLRLTVTAGPEDDYDIELFYNRRGKLEEVDSSGKAAGEAEEIVLTYPEPGDYVLRVNNYAASGPWTGNLELFPGRFTRTDTGVREAWTLTCEERGKVLETRRVTVDRGQRVDLGRLACRR